VPLDRSYPPARLADMLDSVGDTLILTDVDIADRPAWHGRRARPRVECAAVALPACRPMRSRT